MLTDADKRPPHRFRIVARSDMGRGRKNGKRIGFVQSIADAVESFYGDRRYDRSGYQ